MSSFAYGAKTPHAGFLSVIQITIMVHMITIEMHRAAGFGDPSDQGLLDASKQKRLSAARAMASLASQLMKEIDRPGSGLHPKECFGSVTTVSGIIRRPKDRL